MEKRAPRDVSTEPERDRPCVNVILSWPSDVANATAEPSRSQRTIKKKARSHTRDTKNKLYSVRLGPPFFLSGSRSRSVSLVRYRRANLLLLVIRVFATWPEPCVGARVLSPPPSLPASLSLSALLPPPLLLLLSLSSTALGVGHGGTARANDEEGEKKNERKSEPYAPRTERSAGLATL